MSEFPSIRPNEQTNIRPWGQELSKGRLGTRGRILLARSKGAGAWGRGLRAWGMGEAGALGDRMDGCLFERTFVGLFNRFFVRMDGRKFLLSVL